MIGNAEDDSDISGNGGIAGGGGGGELVELETRSNSISDNNSE